MLSGLRATLSVDSLPAGRTPEGVAHLLGNAAEWTETAVPLEMWGWEAPMTPEIPPAFFFSKGGSYRHPISYGSVFFDLSSYDHKPASSMNDELGFRCAKSVRD